MVLTDKQKEIVGKVHDFVKKESDGSFQDDVFGNHVMSVRNYAEQLSEHLKANTFVVIVAALLHDIYFIQTHDHSIHEVEGEKFSREYLKQYDIPNDEQELICKCILNHRGSKSRARESVEEKIIACADAMDHINRFKEMIIRVEEREGKDNPKETIRWVRSKIERGWKKLELDYAKELMKDKYEEALKFLVVD